MKFIYIFLIIKSYKINHKMDFYIVIYEMNNKNIFYSFLQK